jgi:hypothetical protein
VRAAIQAAAQQGLARSLRAAHVARRGDLVGALLEAGADARGLYPGGRCDPLALCIAYGNVSSLKALLKLGHPADRRIKAWPGQLSLAGNESHFGTALHLCIKPPRLPQDQPLSYPPPDLNCLKVLLEEGGADSSIKSSSDYTPLHSLCGLKKNQLDKAGTFDAALDLLLVHGADINAGEELGWTPLVLCAAGGNPAWRPRLLARGADPDVATRDGVTPLIYACRHRDEDRSPAVVMELLRRSSRETRRAVDDRGSSAIDALLNRGIGGADAAGPNPRPRRSPSSTPWKTRAIRQLLLSGATCKPRHARVVLPIAAELMALQDVELEQLRSWAETWQGQYECVSYSFDRLDKEAEEARTVELKKEEAQLLAELEEEGGSSGSDGEGDGNGGGGGGGAGKEAEEQEDDEGKDAPDDGGGGGGSDGG